MVWNILLEETKAKNGTDLSYFRVTVRRRIEEIRVFYVEANDKKGLPDIENYVEDNYTSGTGIDWEHPKTTHTLVIKAVESVSSEEVDNDEENNLYVFGDEIT